MKKILIYIIVGIVVVGAGIGIAYAAGLFDKDKKTDTPIAVASVTIDGKSSIVANNPTTYTAVVLPADATDKTVVWAVSSGQATITAGGVLTATSAGTVIITATSNNSKVGMKTITVYADQTTADNASITAARNAIENASYAVSQTDVIDMETANAFIQTVIDGLELDSGITADIMEDTFHAATPGTQGDTDGEDGSYSFTVTLNKGVGAEQSTATITMIITAIPYDSEVEEQDNAAIGAAKTLIEGAAYTANQTDAIDMVTAKASIQSVIDGLPLDDGIHYVIINGTFTDATAGTALAPDGTDGSFTFTVRISKGLGAEKTTDTLTLEITATAYDSTEQDNLDIAAVKTAIEGATYSAVAQEDINDIAAARAEVQAVLDTLSLNGVTATIVDGVFTPAQEGTALDTDGEDGSYKFTVDLTKGSGVDTTIELTLEITATAYDSTDDDNAAITAAKALIEGASYSAPQTTVIDAATAISAVETIISGLSLDSGIATVINEIDFDAAQAGDIDNPNGENGTFTFTVKLNKGNGDEQTIINLTLEIIATPYDDNARVAAAKTAIENILDGAVYSSATCGGAGGETTTIRLYIEGLISDVDDLYGVNLGVSVQEVVPAFNDTIYNATEINGSAKFTVQIVYGANVISDSVVKEVTIVATDDFTDDRTIEDARDTIVAALPSSVSSATYNTLSDLQAFVNNICDPVKNSHGVTLNTTVDENFEPAQDGTMPEIGNEDSYIGTDGRYTCTITIDKNSGTQRTVEVSITIEAQDFVTTQLVFTQTQVGGVTGYEVSASGLGAEDTGIVIPAMHNGQPVLRIAQSPNGFNNSAIIKIIVIMDGVKEIGMNAFYNCQALQYIAIPNSVETIETGAFQACTSLENIALPDNPKYTTITMGLFQNAGLKSITIPDKVTTIENSAFNGCTALANVTIGVSVETIGNSAFNDCTALAALTLPLSVKSIGSMAFFGMSNPFVLTIENPNIEFPAGNIFAPNRALEIYFNGDQNTFEDLEIYDNSTGVWAPNGTTVHSTLPAKTKVYFKDGSNYTYNL